jgi:2-phospho-L-lactate guanylyltransferase
VDLRWVVVVPVKVLGRAKTRLGLAPAARADLALEMARATVAAAAACPLVAEVVVVTDDPRAAAALRGARVHVVADEPDAGLNPALGHGAAVAAGRHPGAGVAALSADLPALRPDELARALAAGAAHPRAVVADAAGTGTVLLTARPGLPLDPAYGGASRTRHAARGAVDLTDDLRDAVPGLRRDVDTPDDLAAARRLLSGAPR